jgi:hypothetical protein
MVGHTGFEPTLKTPQTSPLFTKLWQWLEQVEVLRREFPFRAHPKADLGRDLHVQRMRYHGRTVHSTVAQLIRRDLFDCTQ